MGLIPQQIWRCCLGFVGFNTGQRPDPDQSQPPITEVRADEPPMLHLAEIPYIAIPYTKPDRLQSSKKTRELSTIGHNEYKPIIVVSVSLDPDSSQDTTDIEIKDFISRAITDDVLFDAFLTETVIFQGAAKHIEQFQRLLAKNPLNVTNKSGHAEKWVPKTFIPVDPLTDPIPSGPYFIGQGLRLYQAWRLYPDTHGSFVSASIPTENDLTFRPLDLRLGGICKAIAVPSRLYSKKTELKPLAGMRFSVKDNFKVAGMATTQSNKAWCELYQNKEDTTAAYVETLINLGAVFVGKTVMCSFASSEEATDQWIDFPAPFNPRGDGYQSPSGSTTGGGTSLAAHEWLDFSIGTDTTGSIRWPAAWAGLFGLRTTWTEGAMQGVYPACRFMDTVGILSRCIHDMDKLVSTTVPGQLDLQSEKLWPTEILYPTDFFPMANDKQEELVAGFVEDLKSCLPIGTEVTRMSIAQYWEKNPPPEANGKPIDKYLEKAAYNPFYYDGYKEYEGFRKAYEAKFKKPVYVGPYMKWKWENGSRVTEEMVKKSNAEVQVYRRWFQERILRSTAGGGTTAIMLIPCGSSTPKYRDEPNKYDDSPSQQ
ncbi:amidase domain-containing protein [Apiospora saccharicola]